MFGPAIDWMIMSLDATITRRIRTLIPDAEAIFGDSEDEYLFTDEEIEDFYEEGFQNTKCAAGLAKMAIGASEALILKVIKNYETTTNGAALMREWQAAGERLYELGLAQVADEELDGGIFEIVYPEFEAYIHPEGRTHGSYGIGGWLG